MPNRSVPTLPCDCRLDHQELVLQRVDQDHDPVTGCWLWIGNISRTNGYGRISHRGRVISGHKFAYEAFRGVVPLGRELDHLCREPKCANPWHLEAVSHRVNVLRSDNAAALNARKTHCVQGHPFSVLPSGRRRCVVCQQARRRQYDRDRPRRKAPKESD